MLKGISSLMSPDLLKTIAAMGHGDEIVIGDGNFPADSMTSRCIRCDGHGVSELLDAVLQLFPLDTFVEKPVTLMSVVAGTMESDPPIWREFEIILEEHQQGTKVEYIDRFAFYERAKKAYACVATGEKSLYACVILKKGVLA